MAIDFHSRKNRTTYAGRQADAGWAEAIRRIVDPAGKLRKVHKSHEALKEDLMRRTGRSILHDLSDGELEALTAYILARLPADDPLIEKDRWTLWSCRTAGVPPAS